MSDRFSVKFARECAESTIVTTFATTADARMHISHKARRCKPSCIRVDMTDAAITLCRDMLMVTVYAGFTRGDARGMAGRAIVGIDTTVVKRTRKANIGVGHVAGRAVQACRYMIQRFSERDVTVMA